MVNSLAYKIITKDSTRVITIEPGYEETEGMGMIACGGYYLTEGPEDLGIMQFDEGHDTWSHDGVGDLEPAELIVIANFIKSYVDPMFEE